MDLKQLECFVRVAELGSFTKAAAALETNQSSLSRQVRQLEIDLRRHLLYRHGRGVTPTESGKRLLAHGRGILHQVALARQELEEDLEASPSGRVVVGLPPSIGKRLAVPLMTRFRERYAKAAIGMVEGLTVAMQEWLLLGRLDLALLFDPAPNTQLEYERIWAESLYLISPITRAQAPATVRLGTLGNYPLVIPSRPNSIRNLVESECTRRHVRLDIAFEIDAISSVLDLVERGLGHAVLSRNAVYGWAKQGRVRVRKIVQPAITSELVIATPAQRPLTRLAQRTVELIKAEIAAGAFEVPGEASRQLRAGGSR